MSKKWDLLIGGEVCPPASGSYYPLTSPVDGAHVAQAVDSLRVAAHRGVPFVLYLIATALLLTAIATPRIPPRWLAHAACLGGAILVHVWATKARTSPSRLRIRV